MVKSICNFCPLFFWLSMNEWLKQRPKLLIICLIVVKPHFFFYSSTKALFEIIVYWKLMRINKLSTFNLEYDWNGIRFQFVRHSHWNTSHHEKKTEEKIEFDTKCSSKKCTDKHQTHGSYESMNSVGKLFPFVCRIHILNARKLWTTAYKSDILPFNFHSVIFSFFSLRLFHLTLFSISNEHWKHSVNVEDTQYTMMYLENCT